MNFKKAYKQLQKAKISIKKVNDFLYDSNVGNLLSYTFEYIEKTLNKISEEEVLRKK